MTEHAWTRARVEQALIAAFRLVPGHPVFSAGGGFLVDGASSAAAEPLSWGLRHLADDQRGRRMLFAYARCRATNMSWSAFCAEAGWPKSSADAARVRAALTVASRLNFGRNGGVAAR